MRVRLGSGCFFLVARLILSESEGVEIFENASAKNDRKELGEKS